jgi:hypothetical protein
MSCSRRSSRDRDDMPRVVPSQVAELIDQLYPNAKTANQIQVPMGATGFLQAMISFAKQIPPELITLTGQDLSDYVVAIALIADIREVWLAAGSHWQLSNHRGISPIALLRRALAKCPDEVPAPATATLSFVSDVDLRDSIRRDISAANQDMGTPSGKAPPCWRARRQKPCSYGLSNEQTRR